MAAIGMAVGARAYVEAIGATVLVGVSLVVLAKVEERLIRRRRTQRYLLSLQPLADLLTLVESTFRDQGLTIEAQTVEKTPEGFDATFDVSGPGGLHGTVMGTLAVQAGLRMTRVP